MTPKGIKATQYRTLDLDPPPNGFDPHTADDASVLRYGLPRRPNPVTQPRLARLWKEAFSTRTTFLKAELGEPFVRRHKAERTDKTARPHENISPAVAAPAIVPGSSGGLVINPVLVGSSPFTYDYFTMVFGQWVIPTVMPKNPSGEDLTLGFWVGLEEGDGWNEVLQAGVSATVDSGGKRHLASMV